VIKSKASTSSRIVAGCFQKQHAHVLSDIKNMKCSIEFSQSNFGPAYYTDVQDKQQPEYIITRDGFSFLAFGFTGKQQSGPLPEKCSISKINNYR